LKRAHELYMIKHAKGFDFGFEHCWILLKGHPKWADGWTQVRPPIPKRKVSLCDLESDFVEVLAWQVEGTSATMDEQRLFIRRPGGIKQPKKIRSNLKCVKQQYMLKLRPQRLWLQLICARIDSCRTKTC
jgi:hypothetical protein